MLLLYLLALLLTTDFTDSSDIDQPACTEDQFTCTDGTCIKQSAVNNSRPDCIDNSDEVVVPFPCKRGEFACRSGDCIIAGLVLDGVDHCEDGSDEIKYIGGSCQTGPNITPCSDFVANTACIDGYCECDDPYKPDEDKLKCVIYQPDTLPETTPAGTTQNAETSSQPQTTLTVETVDPTTEPPTQYTTEPTTEAPTEPFTEAQSTTIEGTTAGPTTEVSITTQNTESRTTAAATETPTEPGTTAEEQKTTEDVPITTASNPDTTTAATVVSTTQAPTSSESTVATRGQTDALTTPDTTNAKTSDLPRSTEAETVKPVTDEITTPLIETEAPTSLRPTASKIMKEEEPRWTNKDMAIRVVCGVTIFVLAVADVILIILIYSKFVAK